MLVPLKDPAEEPSTMTKITTMGLDIAKSSFAVHGFDAAGKTVLKKELKRGQVLSFFASLEPCRVVITVPVHLIRLRCQCI
jgi:transposase